MYVGVRTCPSGENCWRGRRGRCGRRKSKPSRLRTRRAETDEGTKETEATHRRAAERDLISALLCGHSHPIPGKIHLKFYSLLPDSATQESAPEFTPSHWCTLLLLALGPACSERLHVTQSTPVFKPQHLSAHLRVVLCPFNRIISILCSMHFNSVIVNF